MTIVLGYEQEQAVEAVKADIKRQGWAFLGGYAGTGKSTLQDYIIKNVYPNKRPVLMAPTWKAARRMSEITGYRASSMHGLIYSGCYIDKETKELVFEGRSQDAFARGDLAIGDEVSMVGGKLGNDLTYATAKVPTIFMGDLFQVPPVSTKRSPNPPYFTRDKLSYELTKVYRQAEGSASLQFLTALREGRASGYLDAKRFADGKELKTPGSLSPRIWQHFVKTRMGDDEGQILVHSNWLRQDLNTKVRAFLGHTDRICPGDKLLALTNKDQFVNGDTVIVKDVLPYDIQDSPDLAEVQDVFPVDMALRRVTFTDGREAVVSELQLELGHKKFMGKVNEVIKQLNKKHYNRLKRAMRDLLLWDYGFALTIHKAQGSQWKSTLCVITGSMQKATNKENPMGAQRLIYTQHSRHIEECVSVVG